MNYLSNRNKPPLSVPVEQKELANEFYSWYISAKPGNRFIYYFGEHLHENIASEYLRRMVWDFACNGKVYIFQSRDEIERNKFNYIAIKPRSRVKSLIPRSLTTERRYD